MEKERERLLASGADGAREGEGWGVSLVGDQREGHVIVNLF